MDFVSVEVFPCKARIKKFDIHKIHRMRTICRRPVTVQNPMRLKIIERESPLLESFSRTSTEHIKKNQRPKNVNSKKKRLWNGQLVRSKSGYYKKTIVRI